MNCLNKNLNLSDYLALLARWVKAAERDYHPLDGTPDLGYYGTAYRHWGHQSIANYASAYATLATLASDDIIAISGVSRDFLYERALAALRYFLRLHTTGDLVSQDGTKWGTDWISGNLFLRGVAAIDALWDKFTDEDKQRVEKMVEAEAEHLMKQPIICNRWPERPELGRTNAEANSWNGSMLLHAIIYLPDHARKAAWWEQACRYFINTLSVPQDAEDQRLVDGRPIAEWHVGANLHPNFGFEHHGFLHFGYMVISLEELVFTWAQCRRHRLAPPQSLFHHWQEVWQVIKHSYISPGRLGYLAGEDWSRYLYCQAYFISMLPGLQKRLGDADARFMELELFDNVKLEQTANGDGSFCAKRLAALAAKDPVAFYRFESDYPGFFARAAVYYTLQDEGKLPAPPAPAEFEQHLAGIYQEPDAKFISQRTPTRLP
ncbi:MAG TPA: hypothetical protein GXX29_01560, partial [Firmicutes bacterium]|nr:hypothetical protein [Bacillota bacterium]